MTRHRRLLIEAGVVPCRVCRRPHDYRWESPRSASATWADPTDGHVYERMDAEAAMAEARADLARRIEARVRNECRYAADLELCPECAGVVLALREEAAR